MRICEALDEITDCDTDTYWLAKGFYQLLKSFKPSVGILISYTDKMLLKEDEALHR